MGPPREFRFDSRYIHTPLNLPSGPSKEPQFPRRRRGITCPGALSCGWKTRVLLTASLRARPVYSRPFLCSPDSPAGGISILFQESRNRPSPHGMTQTSPGSSTDPSTQNPSFHPAKRSLRLWGRMGEEEGITVTKPSLEPEAFI